MDQNAANIFIQGMDRIAHKIVGAIHRTVGFVNNRPDVYPFTLGPAETLPLTVAANGTGILNYVVPANTTFHLTHFMHQVTSEALLAAVHIDANAVALSNQEVLIECFSNAIDLTDTNERTLYKLPIPYTFIGPANFNVTFTDLSGSENAVKLYAIGVRDNRRQAEASGTHARMMVASNNIQGDMPW